MVLDNDALNGWYAFLERIKEFFLTDDAYGINYLTRIVFAVLTIILGWLFITLFIWILKKILHIKKKGPNVDVSARWFVVQLIKVFLWLAVAFLVISILNIQVAGFAGVISAVTVALGLALQDVISCVASGLILINQKHIKGGEYIKVKNAFGEVEGTVVKIEFIFTFLKTYDGLELTIPNNNMLKAEIFNYTRLGSRRVDIDIDITYQEDIEKCKKVFTELMENDPAPFKDETIKVFVSDFGPYQVKLRLRCWVSVDDYWPYRYRIYEQILAACRENNIYIPCSTDIQVSNQNK